MGKKVHQYPMYAVKNTTSGFIISDSITFDYDQAVSYASDSPFHKKTWTVIEIEIREVAHSKPSRKLF